MIWPRWIAASLLLLAPCGCGSKGPGPTTTAPQIACPADANVSGITGSGQAVGFTAPIVTAGAPPVTTTCAPASGDTFPLGATTVTCTAGDAQARQATCSFKVTLTALTIAVKKFDAIGDSLTEGENGRPPAFLDLPNAYPTKLQALFDVTFPGQGIQVVNRGVSGWPVERTVDELPGDLSIDRPGGVLLLSGFNNLFEGCGNGPVDTRACRAALETVQFGIRDCIRRSKDFSVGYIFVSTLTPPGPVLPGAPRDRRIAGDAIVQANDRIRQIVAVEGATLVDPYPLFIGHEPEYVDTDGLHLRPAGNQVLADTFFAAIRATVPQTSLSTASALR
jgi:lysophospholipase L1-like esterase